MVDPANSGDSRDPGRSRFLRPSTLLALGALMLIAWQFLMPRNAARNTQPVPAGPDADGQEHPKTAFEPSDWPLAPIGLIFIGALALLVIPCFVLIAAYPTSLPDVGRSLRISPPGPRLQTDPEAELARFRAEETKRLSTYYWIDKQKGVVHIPIEQAMKNLVRDGVAGFPKARP